MSATLPRILQVIGEFEAGGFDVEVLQSRLDAQAATLDNSDRLVLDELRALDGDLERIRFTMHSRDQHVAARDRLRQLKKIIEDEDTIIEDED